MALNPQIDRFDILECEEQNGVVRSLTRLARVVGMSPTYTDYRVLWAALATAGIPPYGATLVDYTNPTTQGQTRPMQDLRLVDRKAKMAEMDPGCYDVTLRYAHVLDGPNQIISCLGSPGSSPLFTKSRSSVVQKPTNFWYANGEPVSIVGGVPVANPKIQILVGHKFPFNDESYPDTIKIQGGEISLPFPQENLRLEGVVYTANPRAIKNTIHRHVNLKDWLDPGDARMWLCTEVQFDLLSSYPVLPGVLKAGTQLYRFEFEFQKDFDTWDQTAVFKDNRTGLPPSNIVPGILPDPNDPATDDLQPDPVTGQNFPAGYFKVPALPALDYPGFFRAVLDGAS